MLWYRFYYDRCFCLSYSAWRVFNLCFSKFISLIISLCLLRFFLIIWILLDLLLSFYSCSFFSSSFFSSIYFIFWLTIETLWRLVTLDAWFSTAFSISSIKYATSSAINLFLILTFEIPSLIPRLNLTSGLNYVLSTCFILGIYFFDGETWRGCIYPLCYLSFYPKFWNNTGFALTIFSFSING